MMSYEVKTIAVPGISRTRLSEYPLKTPRKPEDFKIFPASSKTPLLWFECIPSICNLHFIKSKGVLIVAQPNPVAKPAIKSQDQKNKEILHLDRSF